MVSSRRLELSRYAHIAVRAVWVITFLYVVTLFIAAVPAANAHYHQICPSIHCNDWRLTHLGIRSLHSLGLSLDAYAVYIIALNLVSAALWLTLGLLMFLRGGTDRMALFAAFFLVLFTGGTYGGVIASLAASQPAWRLPVNVIEFLGQLSVVVFFLVFPDGRFAPRWSALLIVPALLVSLAPVYASILPTLSPYSSVLNGLLAGLYLVAIGNQVWRYRVVSTDQQRRQTRWVVLGCILTVLSLAGLVVFQVVGGASMSAEQQQGALLNMVIYAAWYVILIPIPVSIVLAVTRSRLWDIDILINRTLVYGSLTITLVVLYIGAVIVLQALFRALTGQHSDLAIAIATLGVAAVFNPLRHRLQEFIDRRFYRRKYDAVRTLAAFSTHLRDEVNLDQLSGELTAIVQETMQPASVAVWVRRGEKA